MPNINIYIKFISQVSFSYHYLTFIIYICVYIINKTYNIFLFSSKSNMTTNELAPLLLQILLKQNSFSNLFNPSGGIQNGGLQQAQKMLNEQLNMMVHSQLVQTILEQKLKNEILMNALLMNSKLPDPKGNNLIQNPPIQMVNLKKKEKCQYVTKIERSIEGDSMSDEDDSNKNEPNSTDLLLEEKKIGAGSYKRIKNETKNIPKNYGKAIISFIEKNDKLVKRILLQCDNMDFANFMMSIRQKKKKLNSIADLRALWLQQENSFAKPTRILSFIFLKQHSLTYIFNSRVTNFTGHIKYRYRLIEALRNPRHFTSIKVF